MDWKLFFTKIGLLIAWVIFGLGIFRTATGFYVAIMFDTQESMIAASKRYLATANSGEAINHGLAMLAVGLVIGILAEISKNSRY